MKDVNVLSYYFTHGRAEHCFPRTIEVEGKQFDFLENGLRCLVRRGQEFVQIFNMSDGRNLYRVSFEPGDRTWKLLGSRPL